MTGPDHHHLSTPGDEVERWPPLHGRRFLFWYEDIYKNKELNPTPSLFLSINGKPGEVEKVDTYTVRFRFADPYPIFPEMLAGATPIGAAIRCAAGRAWGAMPRPIT